MGKSQKNITVYRDDTKGDYHLSKLTSLRSIKIKPEDWNWLELRRLRKGQTSPLIDLQASGMTRKKRKRR